VAGLKNKIGQTRQTNAQRTNNWGTAYYFSYNVLKFRTMF